MQERKHIQNYRNTPWLKGYFFVPTWSLKSLWISLLRQLIDMGCASKCTSTTLCRFTNTWNLTSKILLFSTETVPFSSLLFWKQIDNRIVQIWVVQFKTDIQSAYTLFVLLFVHCIYIIVCVLCVIDIAHRCQIYIALNQLD